MHDKYWFGKEILSDHHIYLNRRYTNIFESRATKCIFFLDDMPKRVKHFMLIRYEDLIDPVLAKSIFHMIAKKVWNTDYPNINENHYIQAISHDTNSHHRTNKRDHNSQDHAPKTKSYSLPADAIALIEEHLNKTVELRMGYMVWDIFNLNQALLAAINYGVHHQKQRSLRSRDRVSCKIRGSRNQSIPPFL